MEGYKETAAIHILTEYSEKLIWEQSLRSLWQTCFHDPQHYEDFYFDKVYANNKVYAIKDMGMVHVNFYRCKVLGHDMTLPYIVGVATDERYRRQGVMRKLLEKVLSDLKNEHVPFTYLMPAREEYYIPFGFRSVTKKSGCEVTSAFVGSKKLRYYMSYEEFCNQSEEFQLQLLENIDQWLKHKYDVYAVHDKSYYDLLYAEKMCQSGDIIFCFDDFIDAEKFCGVFAYAMDEETPYVEQILVKESMLQASNATEELLCSYFDTCSTIKMTKAYPYMLRIVHRDAFIELFGEKLSKMLAQPMEEWTDEQMITSLFVEKGNIYFAEIV